MTTSSNFLLCMTVSNKIKLKGKTDPLFLWEFSQRLYKRYLGKKTCFKLGSILLKLLLTYPGTHMIECRKNSFNITAAGETWMQFSHVVSKSIWYFCFVCSSSPALNQTSQMSGCYANYQWGKKHSLRVVDFIL